MESSGKCYVSEEKWKKGFVEPERWIEVMKQAHHMGVPFVSFLGGDPSLYPGIADLIRACDVIGIKGSITTNGIKMRDELLDAIISTNLLTPTLSLQSLDDLHTALTGRSQDQTIRSIKRILRSGKSCNVNLVYTEQNLEQILDVVNLCLELGVDKLSIGVFVNINHASVQVPSFSAYRRLYEKVMEYLEHRKASLVFQVEGCQLYTAYPGISNPVETEYEKLTLGCEAGNGRCEILHDGTLLPCALLNKHRWGDVNVFELGLQRAWNEGNALKRIRTYKNKDTSCKKCAYSSFCNGGCPAMNERTYRSIEEYGDPRCEIRKNIQMLGKS